MNALITTQSVITMTTREIADLIEKRHDHIKVSTERLAAKGVIGTPAVREFSHNGNIYTEYLLNKRDSLILVAQNCPEFTAKIVDRWQELESQNPMVNLSRLEILKIALDSEEQRLRLVEKVEVLEPKAEALDRIATFADGSMCITNAAKSLQVQPKVLFGWLSQNQWIYRRTGSTSWLAYQVKLQAGLLEHKVSTFSRPDGTEKVVEQVHVTAKGLTKLSELLSIRQAA